MRKSERSVKGRGLVMTVAKFINEYYNDIQKCIEYFINIKWPNGYFCEKCNCKTYYFMKSKNSLRCTACGHDEYLHAGTCFQDTKLAPNKLLYGLFLIFNNSNGITSVELAKELEVNYKTACLLQSKARILMRESNNSHKLDSKYLESDVFYVGAPDGKAGLGTEKLAILAVLATNRENEYPTYIKLVDIVSDKSDYLKPMFNNNVVLDKSVVLNTDGKTTYSFLEDQLTWKHHVIDYESDKTLYYLNKVISNFKSNLIGKYHGIGKRELPLYITEYEWHFNHRRCSNTQLLNRFGKYISESSITTHGMIKKALDTYMVTQAFS